MHDIFTRARTRPMQPLCTRPNAGSTIGYLVLINLVTENESSVICVTYPPRRILRSCRKRTSGKRGGGGFKISDVPGQLRGGWFVKLLKKLKFQIFSELIS